MMQFLLKELERATTLVFSKRELVSRSPGCFEDLKSRKILSYFRPMEDDWEHVSEPRCQHGCALTAERFGGLYEAFCLNHPEEDPILIEEDYLPRWRFCVEALLDGIVRANGIEGGQRHLEPPCIYLGGKIYGGCRIGFVFIPRVDALKQLSLFGIRMLCRDDGIVLLSPASGLDDIPLEAALRQEKMVHVPLAAILDPDTLKLPMGKIVTPLLPERLHTPLAAIETTGEQQRDYDTCKYLCYDRVHIPGDVPSPRNNLVVVNGSTLSLPDASFLLLLRLAVALRESKNGWIETPTLWEEGIIPDPEKHQPFSNLRKALEKHLRLNDAKRFIENDGTKRYRLSTHPNFVTCVRERLLGHPDGRIGKIAMLWMKDAG